MMKLWLKTRQVKFTIDEETKTMTGVVDKDAFISAALNDIGYAYGGYFLHVVIDHIYNINYYNKEEDTITKGIPEYMYLKNSPIQVHKEMLVATAKLLPTDEYNKSDGKRVIMRKLNKRLANYEKLIITKMNKIVRLNDIDNFIKALDAEAKKY